MADFVGMTRQGIKYSSMLIDRVSRPPTGISVLIYHRVGLGRGGQMDLDPSVFRDQMVQLRENHRVVDLDTAVGEFSDGGRALEPGVVITFDDGTSDWIDHVAPILTDTSIPATFYVATDFVERQRDFPHGGTPISWKGLEELSSIELVTIGSHTHTHKLLDRLPEEELEAELDISVRLLEEHTGSTPQHFAYPKAVPPSPLAEAAVRLRFRSAVLAGTRANPAGTDPYRISRSPIQPSDGARFFAAKASGGLGLEDTIRRSVNKVRHRHRTT